MPPGDSVTPETPSAQQASGPAQLLPVGEPTAPSGRRQALRDLRRELTDADLASPGVQKLLLDDLERRDAECEFLTGFRERFHDADKRVAVLEQKLHAQNLVDICFGVGLAVGGALVGVSPNLWAQQPYGWILLIGGVGMCVGAAALRIVAR